MHQDIEKLLNAAKEKGSITEKQREIILNKAQQLGEDMTEVEFMLEDIPIRKSVNEKLKKKKCPNCGALVADMELKCTECGYTFQNESEANRSVRDIINETERKIKEAQNSDRKQIFNEIKKAKGNREDDELLNMEIDFKVDDIIHERVLSAISSFSVPYTSNALIQAFEYTYGQYEQHKIDNFGSAWLGKSKELYNLIRSQPTLDDATQRWIENHKDILNESQWKNTSKYMYFTFAILLLIVLTIIFAK